MKKIDNRLPELDKLQAKIDELKEQTSPPAKKERNGDMAYAMRLIIDLVAGVTMGLGVGYYLDKWSGLSPLFILLGLFIGMAAGVKNMVRSAEIIDKELGEQQKDDKIL